MRDIAKGPEPRSLIEHRANQHCDYENYPRKDELRQALVGEQRGLCCYCMGRIRTDAASMKIEHWKSQARFPGNQLAYSNLLGACRGGEGLPYDRQHCDTRKREHDLLWNPALAEHPIEPHLTYELDGKIRADNEVFDHQLDEVLNLNLPFLKNNRKSALTGLLQWWKENKPVPREQIERVIHRKTAGSDTLKPFCQVEIWWLRRKLAR